MAEQLTAPAPTFYLRFKPAERREWVRRHLFCLGWSAVQNPRLASPFATREDAEHWARLYKLTGDVEVVEVPAGEVHAA